MDEDTQNDEDKMKHTRIGKTEISVGKALQNLMVLDEYVTYRNIVFTEDEQVK